MMRVAIVAGKLVSGFDVPHGIELGPAIGDPGKDIGIAGMIHELKRASVHASVNGLFLAQFNDGDPLLSLYSLLCLGYGDALSGILANLFPRADETVRVKPCSLDPAFSDDQHCSSQRNSITVLAKPAHILIERAVLHLAPEAAGLS
jgi:hypothetical protein